jgi:PPOX class probable F420-dependent enzyme
VPRSELTQPQRKFLDEKRFAVLATVNRDGSPHLTVMWYLLEGDEIVFNTAAGRQKPKNLDRDPRASLIVHDGYRFVRVEGRVRRIDEREATQQDIRRLAQRYYESQSRTAGAMERFSKQERITYRMRIQRVYSAEV